jgi:hypothetical protein
VNKSLEIMNFPYIKEKSWSSRVIEGYIFQGKVRAQQCAECKSSCELVTLGVGDSNSILCGCAKDKCKHILIHMKFPSDFRNDATSDSV